MKIKETTKISWALLEWVQRVQLQPLILRKNQLYQSILEN